MSQVLEGNKGGHFGGWSNDWSNGLSQDLALLEAGPVTTEQPPAPSGENPDSPGAFSGKSPNPEDYQGYIGTVEGEANPPQTKAPQANPAGDNSTSQPAPVSTPSADFNSIAWSSVDVLWRNWRVLKPEGSVQQDALTVADLNFALKDKRLSQGDAQAVGKLLDNQEAFTLLDRLDGTQDGSIAASMLANYALEQPTNDSAAASPTAPGLQAGAGKVEDNADEGGLSLPAGSEIQKPVHYSGAMFRFAEQLLKRPSLLAAAGPGGTFSRNALYASEDPSARSLAREGDSFRQLDALDGKQDGVVHAKAVTALVASPRDWLFESQANDSSGQSVMSAALSAMADDYKSSAQPPSVPGGVDRKACFRMVFALEDHFDEIVPPGAGGAETVDAEKISAFLNKSGTSVSSEDRLSLSQLSRNQKVLDWLATAGGGQIGRDRVSEVATQWNRWQFSGVMSAQAVLAQGLDLSGYPKTKFRQNMSAEFCAQQVLNTGEVGKAYERIMADRNIQQDLRAQVAGLLPDREGLLKRMVTRMSDPAYVDFVTWKAAELAAAGNSSLGGAKDLFLKDLYALNLVDAESAKKIGDLVTKQLVLKDLEQSGLADDPATLAIQHKVASDVLTVLRTERVTARLGGNVLGLLDQLHAVPRDWQRLTALVTQVSLDPSLLKSKDFFEATKAIGLSDALQALNRAGVLATIAGGFGVLNGIYKATHGGMGNTPYDRLQNALYVLAPLSYGTHYAKFVGYYFMEKSGADNSNRLLKIASLAGDSLEEIIRTPVTGATPVGARPPTFADGVEVPSVSVGVKGHALILKTLVVGSDIAGGILAAVMSGFEIRSALKAHDSVQLAGGILQATSGGLWAVGGLLSTVVSALTMPFFVGSGITALLGMMLSSFKDHGKEFAANFMDSFGNLQDSDCLRDDWRDKLDKWYDENHV